MPGPPPKPASQRRRRNAPKSYGAAEPALVRAAAKAPTLGFRAHKLVTALWKSLTVSIEGRYYSDADWQRARIELWYLNQLIEANRVPGAHSWAAMQSGLNAMMVSAAEKRRLGIELQRLDGDADEDAALSDLADYRARLSS